jgi:hypothetical protein
MHIQDFYAKLMSDSTDNSFFAALRQLTLLDDPRSAFDDDNSLNTWVTWVPSATPNLA